jgi:transposase
VGDCRAPAPGPPRPPYGGRHRTISDRACLAAIVYMARTSTPWRLPPARELGGGSPATCWRRLTEWANAGVFDQLHPRVLDRLGQRGQLDWSRVSVDTMSVRAKRGGPRGRNPVDRGKPGTKLHLARDASGLPLTAVVTAANVNDTTRFEAVVADLPPVRTPAGRRRTRPGAVHADKGDDSRANRAYPRRRGSGRGSPEAGSSPGPGWVATGGRSSGRCRGCVVGGGWRCAGTEMRGDGSRLCWWLVRWCASTASNQPEGVRRRLSHHIPSRSWTGSACGRWP